MDDDDRLRYLFAQAFETGMPTDDCPSADTLLDAVHRALPPDERGVVVDHIASCSVCAEAWRLARGTPLAPARRED